MLTLCPHCQTVFRLQAAQLSRARGFVECGACDLVFSALDRLADEPVSAAMPAAVSAQVANPPAAAEREGPRIADAGLDEVIPGDSAPPMPRITLLEADETPRPDLTLAPAVLREDLARLAARERSRGTWFWGLAACLLFAGLLTQVSWYWRADLLTRLPQLTPYVSAICAKLHCRVEQALSVADIALIARDVRDHPQYLDTLLVNATLLNRGQAASAFPVIQLGVFDRRGVAVGVRRFAPKEYLDRSIDISAGMPAGHSVYIVLEIAGIGNRADSFEFTFL